MRRRVIGYGLTVAALTGALVASGGMAAGVQPAFICPDGGGWVKVDGPFGQTVTVDAPTGSLIVEVCYKAGPNSSTYTVEPTEGVSITSSLLNNGGQVADISHYSVRLVPVVVESPVPTVTPTPDPTYTIEPTPFPPLEPPIVAVPEEPVLAPTGLEGWFWGLLALAAGLTVAGWWAVRRTTRGARDFRAAHDVLMLIREKSETAVRRSHDSERSTD